MVLINGIRDFSDAMRDQITARVFGSADLSTLKAKYPNGLLSRHAVMHGIDASYATKENSIRAFFVLDTVRAILGLLT